MAPSRRVASNGRSPLVRKQGQITTFFSPGKTPKASPSPNPSPNPNPSSKKKKKTPLLIPSPPNPIPNPKTPSTANKKNYGDEAIGKKLRVFWPPDETGYQGQVNSFDKVSGKHLIQYEDAEEEHLDLDKEKIEWVEEEGQPRKLRRLRRISSSPVLKMEVGESSGESDDEDDEDWGKGKDEGDEDSEEVELEEEDEEEEVVVKRSGSGRARSSSCGMSGKRKKVDVEKLGCSKKFRFNEDRDGKKGGSPVTPASKRKSFISSTMESK